MDYIEWVDWWPNLKNLHIIPRQPLEHNHSPIYPHNIYSNEKYNN